MRLLTLTLDNFQGIEHREFDFKGRSASIYGDNATGKTTVFNALTWLLFDKASTGAKNFSPKRRDANGEIHNLDNTVTADFEDADGSRTEYRKTFREIWKKKRGSAEAEYSGNTADYFINGIPKTLKEYQQSISEQFGTTEQMMTLFMPDYFSDALGWQDRRRILIEVCGDVSDEMVIESNKELSELTSFLTSDGRNYTVDDYRKVALARRTQINERLEMLPARIDEAKKAVPEIPQDATPDGLKTQIELLEAEKSKIIADGDAARACSDTERKLSDLRAEYDSLRKRYEMESKNAVLETEAEMKRLADRKVQIASDMTGKKSQIADIERDIQLYTTKIKTQTDEKAQYQAQTWNKNSELCATCGRPLPDDQIEAMRTAFHEKQSANIALCDATIKRYEDILNSLAAKKEETADALNTLTAEHNAVSAELAEANDKIPTVIPFAETPEAKELIAQGEKIKSEAAFAMVRRAQEDENRKAMLEGVNARIDELNRTLHLMSVKDIQQTRISELIEEEETLSAEFVRIEQGLFLCDEFIKTKVSMLNEKINGRFKNVHFRLFINQINGGVKDDCEVMIPTADGTLVPYTFANNAAKINAGLEIISVLSDYWNISIPVVIDNAESVTRLNAFNTQTIRLVVSEPDKTLRLELD